MIGVRPRLFILCMSLVLLAPAGEVEAQQNIGDSYIIQPGDTWSALAWRFGNIHGTEFPAPVHPNRQRQPVIGSSLPLSAGDLANAGHLFRTDHGGLLQLAAANGVSPWLIAMRNDRQHPFQPILHGAIMVPGGDKPPRELPPGFRTLELTALNGNPGQAIAFRAEASNVVTVSASLDDVPMATFLSADAALGLGGTGAFFGSGEPELTIVVDGMYSWSQPWRFEEVDWEYQQLTLSGAAAAIDQKDIARERARLFELWSKVTPVPYWNRPFQLPIVDFIGVSSLYGARRSYNGGPYRTYHEGLDFSAYGGTEVFAAAEAEVVLAEELVVRGGAVILDHGMGVYTGYYHLSDVSVEVGDFVSAGQLIGRVGTTGLSTGNHLHWDFLVNKTWVDPTAWINQDIACWILDGLNLECER